MMSKKTPGRPNSVSCYNITTTQNIKIELEGEGGPCPKSKVDILSNKNKYLLITKSVRKHFVTTQTQPQPPSTLTDGGFDTKMTMQTTPPHHPTHPVTQNLNGSPQKPQMNIYWPQLNIILSATTSKSTTMTSTTTTIFHNFLTQFWPNNNNNIKKQIKNNSNTNKKKISQLFLTKFWPNLKLIFCIINNISNNNDKNNNNTIAYPILTKI